MNRPLAVTIGIVCIAGIIFIAIAAALYQADRKAPSQVEVDGWVYELTTTPGRQQAALDEIVHAGDGVIFHLFPYMNDPRFLASENVRFLNDNMKNPPEKYYVTHANTVGEFVLEYLCYYTAACRAPGGSENTAAAIRALSEVCFARYEKQPHQLCPATTFRRRKAAVAP